MSEAALRALRLQQEFRDRALVAETASEFHRADWQPRSEEAIAADYAEALREIIAETDSAPQ